MPRDTDLDQALIELLKKSAAEKRSVASMIRTIRDKLGADCNALVVMRYFMESFGLAFSQVRNIEGAVALGNSAYSDEDIEGMMQPLIQKNFSLMGSSIV